MGAAKLSFVGHRNRNSCVHLSITNFKGKITRAVSCLPTITNRKKNI